MLSASVVGLFVTFNAVAALPDGFSTFFTSSGCPPGWFAIPLANGRIAVSVSNASDSGVTVGLPLHDQEDRAHRHDYVASVTLDRKSIAAIADDNHQAARHGTFVIAGTSSAHSSGYPFTQLIFCRFRLSAGVAGRDNSTVGFGTIAYFDPEVSQCPAGWQAKDDLNGRIMVPSFAEGGPVSNHVPALFSGESRRHSHNFSVSFATADVSFAGVEGCCDSDPAKAATVLVESVLESASVDIPYVQLLTCVNVEYTFDVRMPDGALLYQEVECPPGWSIATTVAGRFLVALPTADAAPGAAFGGPTLPSMDPPINPLHDHTVVGNITLPHASVLLDSGCCSGGYAGSGEYTYRGHSSHASAELPYTMVAMCQRS